jgi:hypothetical protein
VLLATAASLIGCSSDGEPCAPYDCDLVAHLTGKLELDAAVTNLDVELCVAQRCTNGTLEVPLASGAYKTGNWLPHERTAFTEHALYLERADDGRVKLSAAFHFNDASVPRGEAEYTIRLTDHDSGATLLDEAREAVVPAKRVDSCHVCGSTSVEL